MACMALAIFLLWLLLSLPLSILCDDIEEIAAINPQPLLDQLLSSDCWCDADGACPDCDVARIAYLIIVHNNRTLEDATPLFRAIRSPYNLIFVHVDLKLDFNVYRHSSLREEIIACPCGSEVIVDSVHSAQWSAWSMNDPLFWGMEQALLRGDQWDVFINLSGDSMPVYTPAVIGRLFANELKGINFATSSSCETGFLPTNVYHFPDWWHKRRHYTRNPGGDVEIDFVNDEGHNDSITMQIHFGSQWVALLPDFCSYVIQSLARPDSLVSRFRDYLIAAGRLMTDETFIATLLMHVAPFNETTLPPVLANGSLATRPEMTALRYERMDEHVPSAFGVVPLRQHYDVPKSAMVDAPKPWGPYFLGIYDLRSIRRTGALYIRKVSELVEPNLYQILPAARVEDIPSLFWPNEVKVSEKVDWIQRMEDVKRKILEEEAAKEKREQEAKRHSHTQPGRNSSAAVDE
ncbi:Core-2/I-Branching enzyme [Fragilaria crotonensis]|nr:Core-2/I-Branching enzyme [Fragilaria crotonensis]